MSKSNVIGTLPPPPEGYGYLMRCEGPQELRFRWRTLRRERGHWWYWTIPSMGVGGKYWEWSNP